MSESFIPTSELRFLIRLSADQPIHDYRSSLAADRERLLKLHFGLIERGIFVRPGGGHYFSMMHTDADVATTLEAIDSIIVEME